MADQTGDTVGGPGRLGQAGGVAPAGTDLALVRVIDSGKAIVMHLESTDDLAEAIATSEGLTWIVRLWQGEEQEDPQYVLGVTTVGPGAGPGPLRAFLCEAPQLSSCPQALDTIRAAGGRVALQDQALEVVLPRELVASLGASFQWAAEVTGNATSSAANQWWDFAPDWPRGDGFKAATGEGPDGAVPMGPTADGERRRRDGPPHPESDARVWHRPPA